jgi:hypothetical protein
MSWVYLMNFKKNMITVNKLKKEYGAILTEASRINIQQIFIAENKGNDQYEEDEYLNPYSFIVSKKDDCALSGEQLGEFQSYLQSKFEDIGIVVFPKDMLEFNVSDRNLLSEISKHLLDSAIDITQIDTGRSWKVQFQEQRNKVNLLSTDMSGAAKESLDNLEQELGHANKKRRTGVSCIESDAEIKADDVLSVSSPTTLAAVDSVLGKQEFMRSIGLTAEDILFIKQRPGLFEKISNIADLTKPEERNMNSPARSPSPTKSRSSQHQEQQSSKT